MKEDSFKFDSAWKAEVRKLASESATRSWIIAAILAPFYMLFELGGSEEQFRIVMILSLSVSSLMLLAIYLKSKIVLSEFIISYGVAAMLTICAVIMCAITSPNNVHYYLLVVSLISMSKGILYIIELKQLLIISIFSHLLAYSATIIFRSEPILELPEIFPTFFYQFILLLFSFTGAKVRYFLSRDNFIKGLKIKQSQKRGDDLLFNILPKEIALELKDKGKADARYFKSVAILFSDFKDFTAASERLSAHDLVCEINTCFEAFDHIMEKYNIEKIKTIGDSYMAAGGLPLQIDGFVKNTVLAALEMQEFISKRKEENDAAKKPAFEMRIGINTGPVVAGIVGVKKFQYDIWSDTVNIASRMESHGRVGKVNISQATYEILKGDSQFSFESRGKIEVKGKGEIKMWFVHNA